MCNGSMIAQQVLGCNATATFVTTFEEKSAQIISRVARRCHSYFVFALEFIRISCYIISSFDLKEKFLGIFLSHISKKLLMISLRLGLLLISISFTQLVRAQCWKEKDSNSPKYYTFNGSISCLKNEFTPKDALSM
jgi:hypothetical protein